MKIRPTRVVLVRPRNPLNIGACARAMANFGLSDLVVLDPYEPIWRETLSAPGAETLVKEARLASSWEEAVRDCEIRLATSSFHQRPYKHAMIHLPDLAQWLAPFPASAPAAILFGSERSGLSNEELSRCQAVLRIPTQMAAPSMNLAQAVAIVLYELRRTGWEKAPAVKPASAAEMDALVDNLAALGKTADYPPGYTPEARLGRIRRAFQDTAFSPASARLLLSLARRLRKKHAS